MSSHIIFCDLDGTLLSADYRPNAAAQRALAALERAGIPLILCSAKTRAEQAPIRAALGLRHPYIVENGSAIYAGEDRPDFSLVLGSESSVIRDRLSTIAAELSLALVGYGDLSVEEIAALTGLDRDGAARAQKREFSETIVSPLDDADRQRLIAACADHGLRAAHGGRFITVTSASADKGAAVRRLLTILPSSTRTRPITHAIGDSANDLPMFAAVDHAYLVQRPDGMWADLDLPQVIRVAGVAGAGVLLVVDRILSG